MEALDLVTVLHPSHKGSEEHLWGQETKDLVFGQGRGKKISHLEFLMAALSEARREQICKSCQLTTISVERAVPVRAATAAVRSPLAADAIRKLAENLDKRTDEISAGLTRFSNSGLKEFEAFAIDGRRTLVGLNKAIKNIGQHPTRLIFGR